MRNFFEECGIFLHFLSIILTILGPFPYFINDFHGISGMSYNSTAKMSALEAILTRPSWDFTFRKTNKIILKDEYFGIDWFWKTRSIISSTGGYE